MDGHSLPNCYEFFIRDLPGSHCKVYAARIIGSHPKYVFRRQFIDLYSTPKEDGRLYRFELDEFGVYEYGVNRYADDAEKGDPPLSRSRTRFVVIDGVVDHVILYRDRVMKELRDLKERICREGGAA